MCQVPTQRHTFPCTFLYKQSSSVLPHHYSRLASVQRYRKLLQPKVLQGGGTQMFHYIQVTVKDIALQWEEVGSLKHQSGTNSEIVRINCTMYSVQLISECLSSFQIFPHFCFYFRLQHLPCYLLSITLQGM